MALVQSRDDRVILVIDDAEISEAKLLSDCLSEAGVTSVEIVAPNGQRTPVPTALADLIKAAVDAVARGDQITIQSIPDEATTTAAAKMLGISRPTLMKLIADGELTAHKVGSHTRLKTADVLAFRDRRREAQRHAFDELRELDQGLEMAP